MLRQLGTVAQTGPYISEAPLAIVVAIEPSRFEVRSDLKDVRFSEGGPKALFSVIRGDD